MQDGDIITQKEWEELYKLLFHKIMEIPLDSQYVKIEGIKPSWVQLMIKEKSLMDKGYRLVKIENENKQAPSRNPPLTNIGDYTFFVK